jgi:hypothetical protein
MIEIPQRWQDVLQRLHANGFPEAVIAGGALRDLDHGKPVKDVDIWVRTVVDTRLTRELVTKAMGYEPLVVLFDRDKVKAGDGSEYEDWNDDLQLVVDYAHEAPRGTDWDSVVEDILDPRPHFQVMAMDMPAARDGALSRGDVITNDFDIGLNRIYYDGVSVYQTAAYCIDSLTKSMTVLRCRNEYELDRIKERIERLKQKYPDHQPKNVEVKS